MQPTTTIQAAIRDSAGTARSRLLRRTQDRIPAVVYGGKGEACKITIQHKDIYHALEKESFYTQPFTLSIDGKDEQVILKALQRHPAQDVIVHADFLRITDATTLKVQIPIHLLNEEECQGVRLEDGVLIFETTSVEVSCRANQIPEYLEVDVSELELNQSIMLSELALPEGVTIAVLALGEDHDQLVAQVIKKRVVEEIEPVVAADGEDVDGEGAEGEAEDGEANQDKGDSGQE